MTWFKLTSLVWRKQKALSPRELIASGELPLDRTPTSEEEFAAFDTPGVYRPEAIVDPDVQRRMLSNEDLANDIKEKKRFARHAYRLNWVWVFFLIVITILQGTHYIGFKLDQWSFNIVFGGVTTTVFGFAYLVGKYLFPGRGNEKQVTK